MRITNIKPLFQSGESKFVAEVLLTQDQLDYITSVGVGALLQAGASFLAMEGVNAEAMFDKDDSVVGEQTPKDVTTPQPATE